MGARALAADPSAVGLGAPAPARHPSPERRSAAASPAGALSVAALYVLPALAMVIALTAWRGGSYWEFSEGAYALTARMLLEGSSLYDQVLAAQPPLIFYAAAAVLAIDDSLEALRVALVVPLLATGLMVALSAWRLTWSRPAAVGAGLASLVTPWTLHEQTLLMPETFAAPLLMGAALLAASAGRSKWGGVAAAVAASFKLAFLVPLAAVALAARSRARFAVGALLALAVLWSVFLVMHGDALLENVFRAQWQTGRQAPRLLAGLWLQAGWNLAPLVLLAGLAWPLRHRAHDARLLLSIAALAVGTVALLASLVKHGSYLNVLALAEPPLVALAAFALHALARERGRRARELGALPASTGARRPWSARRGAGVAAVALVLLPVAQSASLIVSPERPAVFARPFSQAPYGWAKSGAEVKRSGRRARHRAAAARLELTPFIAFVARRPMPGGQPDRFILQHAAVHSGVLRATLLDARRSAPSRRPIYAGSDGSH